MLGIDDIIHLPEVPVTLEARAGNVKAVEKAQVIFSTDFNSAVAFFYVAGRFNTDEISKYLPVPSREPTVIISEEIDSDKNLVNPAEFRLSSFVYYKVLEKYV